MKNRDFPGFDNSRVHRPLSVIRQEIEENRKKANEIEEQRLLLIWELESNPDYKICPNQGRYTDENYEDDEDSHIISDNSVEQRRKELDD